MSYDITYLEDEGGVITTYSGIVTDNDMIQCGKARFSSDDRIKSYRYFISDFTNVTEFNVTSDGLRSIADIAINASKLNKRLLLVAVLPTDFQFGMGRMWQTLSEETGWKIQMVRTPAEAQEWIQNNLHV
jgi:hypothetical protein